jgi:NO-binding membrane sensor protein with MHYT domain/nitrogen-specific signal transduction histidine kinase
MNTNYNLYLVMLSLGVAIIATYVSFDLASRIQQAPQSQKRDWLCAGALVLGMGIWTMHFVGMLAMQAPVRLGFALTPTLLSMLPAILAAGIALHLMQRPVLTLKRHLLNSLSMGAGIGAMHYMGMAAMVMLPPISYHFGLVALSVVFAVAGSALTIHLAHASFHALPESRQRSKMLSALVGGLAIAGMHYLGMAATIIPADSVCLSGFQGPSLPHRYNPWLLALSISIAVLASYTALDISGRIRAAIGKTRLYWLAGGGIAMGLGIWTMHFIGMIAMHTSQPVVFDTQITILSVLPALAASTFALYIIARGEMTPRILGLSGLLIAVGIGSMHYIGMAAVQINPPLRYDATFFMLSILVAIAASISALWIGFQQYGEDTLGKSAARKISSAVLMGLAISGMHYTGMTATHISPIEMTRGSGLDPELIAVIAGFATFMVLLLAYVVAFYDARLAEVRADIAKRLKETNEKLTEVDQLKSEFLASMSHELRTPLNSILGFTGIVHQGITGPLNKEQKRQLGMAYDSAKHLLSLINDLLDVSRIEAGRMDLLIELIDIKQLVAEATQSMEQMIAQKKLSLSIHIADSVQLFNCDRKRVLQVLINLLGNAVKFTSQGEITLRCELDAKGLKFSVADTGQGIHHELIPTLFSAFRQIHSPQNRDHNGTGLGLYLCQKLLALMDGKIWVESELGAGSIFSFYLPKVILQGE